MPFDGFISYSHAADGRLAPAVQRGLHRLAKPWHRRRALWIFRDQTGLAVTPALWTSIQQALDGSKYFVLLASPEAASSPWVNREIEHWVATKSPDRILPVVTDGEWRWDAGARDFTADSTAVPAALRGVFTEEPLYLDLRWARDDVHLSLQHIRFRDAIAQLAAPMHGVSKDELEGEDVRYHRRARRLSAVAVATLVLLTLLASLAGVVATRNAGRANAAAAEALRQQRVATEQRGTAERATEESLRQQENARVQEVKAQDAVAETERQAQLAQEQQALAEDAAAEAEREQASAEQYRASADRQKANAERQQAAARDASEDAARQRENAAQQLANARRQQELAKQATARAKEQEKLARHHRELARQANQERIKQEKLAREAAADARRQREQMALQQRAVINRRLMGRARTMITDDPRKALMLGVAAQRLHTDDQTLEELSHLAMSTHYAGALSDAVDAVSVAGQVVAVAGPGGPVTLWQTANPARPARIGLLPPGGNADKTLATSPDGRTLAVCDGSPQAVLWDVTDPAHPVRKAALSDAAGILTVTFSPDGHTVATSNGDKNTVLWDVAPATPSTLATLPEAYPLKFSPDGRTGVTSGTAVTVWDLTDPAHPVRGQALTQLWGDPVVEPVIEFNPKLPVVAVEEYGDYLRLWDLTDPAQPRRGSSQLAASGQSHLNTLRFSPDGGMLALGDSDGSTAVWTFDENDGWPWLPTLVATVTARGGPVRSISFSQDTRALTTVGDRRTATLWNTRGRFARDALAELPGPYPGSIVGLTYGADSRSLLVAGHQGTAVPWDLSEPGRPVRRDAVPLSTGKVEATTISRDGRTLAATGADKTVTLFDLARPAAPTQLATITEEGDLVYAVAFSPDGRTLAVGRRDGKTTLYDLADRRHPALLATLALRKTLTAVTFSPDGHTMAVAEGFNVSLWDLADRAAPVRLTSIALSDFVGYTANALAFSPDGRTLAAGTDNEASAILWDVADPAQPSRIATLIGHSNEIMSLAFTPDGRTLATASLDDAMMLWDLADPATPVRYATMKSPGLQSFYTALSPDGRTLAAGGTYGGPSTAVTLWDTTVPKDLAADPARQACAISGRGLNAEEWARYIPELPFESTC
ncbi:TIR domain-containing protein [Actinoplanes sp. NPDC048967]|uniref:TIR domain-containing protein n=1 Tax=Actinoplanes sp. NPDC048967 TaxID=3155269 RepID=UPI0034023DD0